jgi:hypothetical protein
MRVLPCICGGDSVICLPATHVETVFINLTTFFLGPEDTTQLKVDESIYLVLACAAFGMIELGDCQTVRLCFYPATYKRAPACAEEASSLATWE